MRLEHGDAAHLADPLVVPVGQPLHRLCREAPRLAAVQQNRQDAASVHLSLEPLRDVAGAEDLAARASGRLLEPGLDVVVVGQVVVEQRAEVHERLREADGAAAVEHQVRGVASAVGVRHKELQRPSQLSSAVNHQWSSRIAGDSPRSD